MIRQASGRNQRNKVFIVKNVLQVCILTAVFIWLLYQTKLSYDKNKALRTNNSRILNNVAGSHPDVFDLPRKGLTGNKVPASARDNEEEEDQEVRRAMDNAEVTADDDVINEQDHEGEYEDERESISEEDKDDRPEEVGNIREDHEHEEEDSSQERHEKIYMGDDASSAVLHVNQRTGADDSNSSVQEKDVQTNDTMDRKDDDSKYNNHDDFVTSIISVGNENNRTNSAELIRANVEEIREGRSPVNNKPKQQVNSTIASKSHDSVKMQTNPLVAVPRNETARNGTLMNSVEVLKIQKIQMV